MGIAGDECFASFAWDGRTVEVRGRRGSREWMCMLRLQAKLTLWDVDPEKLRLDFVPFLF